MKNTNPFHDFIIINKSDLIEPFIYVNKESYIEHNKKWFLDFLNNSRSLYINFKNINFNIEEYSYKSIKNQFELDVKRSDFYINSKKISENKLILPKLQKHFNYDFELYQTILFLSSQTSLAFILIKIHMCLLEDELNNKDSVEKNRYYIAELGDKIKNKQNKKMSINVLLNSESVIIDKCLRIAKYDDSHENMLTIEKFKLTFYFTIQNKKINCLLSFKKI